MQIVHQGIDAAEYLSLSSKHLYTSRFVVVLQPRLVDGGVAGSHLLPLFELRRIVVWCLIRLPTMIFCLIEETDCSGIVWIGIGAPYRYKPSITPIFSYDWEVNIQSAVFGINWNARG